jgi:hypothetical protein
MLYFRFRSLPFKASRFLYVPPGLIFKNSTWFSHLSFCVLYGSQNRKRLLTYTALADWFCITEVESVYCAVRTESLYKTEMFSLRFHQLVFRIVYIVYVVSV